MSKEYKLVPVEPTPEMLRAGLASNGIVPVYTAMLAAAPQPPALGGEPETLAVVTLGGYFSSDELGDIDIEPQMPSLERIQQEVVRSDSDEHIELIDRAHLAPLQAEFERLEKQSSYNQDAALRWLEERDQLKARCDELEKAFRKLRDVAHDCEQIASSYSPCIDSVEEHGGDDHDDPSCAIHHRLYYAMFDADAALSRPAGSDCHE